MTDSPPADHLYPQESSFFLVDGSAYVYRAFHAVRELANSKGMPTNAVFGFTRMLIKLIQERRPRFVGIYFDAKGPTFRHKIFGDYKANRPPMPEDLVVQLPYIKKITAGFRIPAVERDGYEADDLIGTCAQRAAAAGYQVVLVTGDKDFLQLVSERISIWDPMKDVTIDLARIRSEYQLEPNQLIDMMGLSGDSSDNVPGVPGIGPKTALKLIQTFGSIESLYSRIDEIGTDKQRDKLIQFKEQAFLSRRLVTIDTQAPVEFSPEQYQLQKPDEHLLTELFQELEFRQLQHEYQQSQAPAETHYSAILDQEQLGNLVERLRAAPRFSLDTETTSQNPMAAALVGISVALEPFEAFYIPCGHRYLGAPDQMSCQQVLALLKPVLEDPSIVKIGQNIKYDWTVLKRHAARLAGVGFDTMLSSYLLNPSKRAHNLDQIALDFLNHKTITYTEVAGKGKQAVTFDQVTLEEAVPYACEDADITLRAHDVLWPQLEALQLTSLYQKVEMPLVPVLMEMEMRGVCLDQNKLRQLSSLFNDQLQLLEKEIYALAGETFNIQSSQQLGRILFEKLQLPTAKKTKKKTGYSTDVEVLTHLAEQHELPAFLLRHRSLAKLKSTYVDALLEQVDPETGRIHTSFNQTVAATGRLSSSNPNLQNIPIRTDEGREIRRAFIPQSGWILMSADYSQIELRILAHVAQDTILMDAFQRDEDIHARTAGEVFEAPAEAVTAELRRQAKAINFGIIYGMSAFGLARELGISQKMAQIYIDHYFARYSGVKTYMESTIAQARATQRTSTLLGRLRLLPDILSKNPTVRQFAERTAINTPIQGTAADLIKLAMIQVAEEIGRRQLKTAMLLSVHDEIVFEVPPEELETVRQVVPALMEQVWELDVPLKVNVACGSNWAEAH
jgi:DNA polymerase-1